MKIGIDIDDTLINTKQQQLIYWKEYVKNNPQKGYTKKLPTIINNFGDTYINNFWDTYRKQLSFKPTFKRNTAKVLNNLKKEGHTLCIVTSRPDEKYNNLHLQLKEWFKNNNIPIDIIYSNVREKGLFCKKQNIDLLIDDDIKHILSAQNNNIKTILFNRNKNYKGLQTTNWNEIEKIIKNII